MNMGTGTYYLTHIISCAMEVTMYKNVKKGADHAENATNEN